MPADPAALARLAAIVADYRVGEIPPMDAAHIDRWVGQFPEPIRDALLAEMAHVLGKTYFSKAKVTRFVRSVVSNAKLTGDDPAAFWKTVRFLDIQSAGNSQRELLALFDTVLQETYGLSVADCGSSAPAHYLYIDDILYSGGRVKADLIDWIATDAPEKASIFVITMAAHTQGLWFAQQDIAKAVQASGKALNINFRCALTVQDRISRVNDADVLRPKHSTDALVDAYIGTLGAAPAFRQTASTGPLNLYSSETSRALLEQEFLREGVRVRAICPLLNTYMRPLGCTLLKTMGFGSMMVTYRNCANNTPLVLWAGDPWYPLFPRKTN